MFGFQRFYPRSSKIISSSITICFYPRSPCGERLFEYIQAGTGILFLSTLSLRRATFSLSLEGHKKLFLSTLSLRRATPVESRSNILITSVSIHALLAESDRYSLRHSTPSGHFYPRSPCGERPLSLPFGAVWIGFYPRSPCGERLHYDNYNLHCVEVSIHALLAESDFMLECNAPTPTVFLSTLSLRRATISARFLRGLPLCFYPRSPCGERLNNTASGLVVQLFLSTLSLRRATLVDLKQEESIEFLSTLSLRRATLVDLNQEESIEFLSTLSLRRATGAKACLYFRASSFYPRSPCGERQR